jgi:hypothetical protein
MPQQGRWPQKVRDFAEIFSVPQCLSGRLLSDDPMHRSPDGRCPRTAPLLRGLGRGGLVRDFRIFRNALPREPRLQHRIHRLGRLLLDPMRDAGKDAERQVGNVFFRAARGAEAERRVGVAPEKERGNLDDGNVAACRQSASRSPEPISATSKWMPLAATRMNSTSGQFMLRRAALPYRVNALYCRL